VTKRLQYYEGIVDKFSCVGSNETKVASYVKSRPPRARVQDFVIVFGRYTYYIFCKLFPGPDGAIPCFGAIRGVEMGSDTPRKVGTYEPGVRVRI
jgi:hypothetical protein